MDAGRAAAAAFDAPGSDERKTYVKRRHSMDFSRYRIDLCPGFKGADIRAVSSVGNGYVIDRAGITTPR
jgi:hypothetical protein